jgi:hypothetical protein
MVRGESLLGSSGYQSVAFDSVPKAFRSKPRLVVANPCSRQTAERERPVAGVPWTTR